MSMGSELLLAAMLIIQQVDNSVAEFSNFTGILDGGDTLDGAMKVIVGVVIGISAAIVVITFLLFGLVQLIIKSNQVQDLDAVEYSIQEEYEARINFEALESMDPEIRARIDLDLLGQLTNTSPEQLAPFKQINTRSSITDDSGGEENSKPVSHLARSSSVQSINHISLKLTKSECCPEEDRSNYNHNKSTATPEKLRRNNTLTDINSCIALNENATPVSPVKFVVRREGDDRTEELAKDFLVAVAGSLLAGTPLPDSGSLRTSPCGKLDGGEVCLDPYVGGDVFARKFEWRHRSFCVEKIVSTEVKETKTLWRRECASEGGACKKKGVREEQMEQRITEGGACEKGGVREEQMAERVTEPRWSKDYNLGEECFAEIERRRTSQKTEVLQDEVESEVESEHMC